MARDACQLGDSLPDPLEAGVSPADVISKSLSHHHSRPAGTFVEKLKECNTSVVNRSKLS